MSRRGNRAAVSVKVVMGALLGVLCLASSASASCGTVIADFDPGYNAIACHFSSGSEETWTVPAHITKPRFSVRGADDTVGGGGGFLSAKLPLKEGETIDLRMGADGGSSSVSRGGELLLVAGGGDGADANYLSPEAEPLEVEEPGQPVGPSVGDGSVYVEWYDAREPFGLVDPLPAVVIDIFDGRGVGFPYTGGGQSWVVPEGVERVLFELWGGPGGSGEPRGHILAGFDVTPGDTFHIRIGGPGEDTTLVRGSTFSVGVAAGGDTERPNYLPWMSSPSEEFWEGGGVGSEPEAGYAIVHYWPPEPQSDPPVSDPPAIDPLSMSLSSNPLSLSIDSAGKALPPCTVPSLKNLTLRAARRTLFRQGCSLDEVKWKKARQRVRGRVVSQKPPPGTVIQEDTEVVVTVGVARSQ
jgi:hypothetical protein